MAVSDEARKRVIDIYENQPQGFASAEVIESLYRDILGRDADPGGLEYYQRFPAHIAAQRMYSSDEAREKGSFAPRAGYDYGISEDLIEQSGREYQFDESGKYKQFQDPNQNPESFASIRQQFGYPHVQALAALQDRIKMRAEGDNRAFSPYESKITGKSENEFNKFTSYVDRLESLYNQGYSINEINELGRGADVTPSFAGTSTVAEASTESGVVSGGTDPVVDDVSAGADSVTNTTNYDPMLNQYYRQLFGRQPRQAGLDYFNQQIAEGNISPDRLREVLISAAGPLDRGYYDASLTGGPLFTATQELFGRTPSQTGFYAFRPEGAPFTGDVDQLRRTLVEQAYKRGEGMGTSRDYQNYLNTLGIDRANSPFAIDGGFANVPYGSDLSQFRDTGTSQTPGFPGFPGFLGKGGGMPQTGGTYQVGAGYRMPGQYITGNQLYSGMFPYGMSGPMGFGGGGKGGGMGGGFGSPYGMSQQYMPNRGLMSGFSTGFGPYGGFQRPSGGKGGGLAPSPMGKGGGFGGYNPYARPNAGPPPPGKGGGYDRRTGLPYSNPYVTGPVNSPGSMFPPGGATDTSRPMTLEELRELGTVPMGDIYVSAPSFYDREGNVTSYANLGYGSQSTGFQPGPANMTELASGTRDIPVDELFPG